MRALCIPLLFLATTSVAQSWCPPGAKWNYEEMSIGFSGYRHRVYEGDTIVLGQPAQRIRTTGIQVDLLSLDTIWINQVHHTSVQNNVLMFLTGSPNGLVWDTLLRFDALPGDRWYPPNYNVLCTGEEPYGMIQVTDTGHVVVDGVSLRRWSYGALGPNGELMGGNEHYYERVGFLNGLVPFPFCGVIIEAGEILICYWDSQLTFNNPSAPSGSTCDITLGTSSSARLTAISLSPNPGREQLTLTLDSSPHGITLLDALGRVVATHANLMGTTTIATEQFPSGPYLLRIESPDGTRTSLRWVKE